MTTRRRTRSESQRAQRLMRVLHLDVETSSRADRRKTGASRYSKDPTTLVTVFGWAFDDEPVQSIVWPISRETIPADVIAHIEGGGTIEAWNASFEWSILTNALGLRVELEQMSCTMQRSLHAGLPAALGDCGPALGLDILKDKTAHGLMMRMARPRAIKNGRATWWHEDDPEKLADLAAYCRRDVEAERAISAYIPELPPREREISLLDARANARGVRIDVDAVQALLDLADEASRALNARCAELTGREVTSPGTQTARLLAWLHGRGVRIDDLGKDVVAEVLRTEKMDAVTREVLELRQLAAKSSVKKLAAMLNVVEADDVVRGLLQYYGAARTGRWSGRLIQPQNMMRPSIKQPNAAIADVMRGMPIDMIEAFHGAALEVVGSCLRGMLVPRARRKFIVFDLAQIEARVLAFVAGQMDIVDVFARGEDVYTHQQKKIGLNSRQEGKVAVLGLGYGMGPTKFIDTAKTYGLAFDEQRAQEIVSDWREANDKIVQFWWACDRVIKAAIKAAKETGRPHTEAINQFVSCEIVKAKNGSPLMTLLLPSGRRLFYRDIALEPNSKALNSRAEFSITYSGVDQFTKKWGSIKSYGGRAVENIVQAIARDVIAEMALKIERLGYVDLLLSVHDELICEVDEDRAAEAYEAVKKIMSTAPDWLDGCPMGADGHVLDRYGKG